MRRSVFPWLLVTAGAVVFWTIALGFGVPSLAALLGEEGPAGHVSTTDTRCEVTAVVDGRPMVFGDCINVRFVSDIPGSSSSEQAPDFADLPAHTVSREAAAAKASKSGDMPEGVPTPPMLDEADPDTVGRTAF